MAFLQHRIKKDKEPTFDGNHFSAMAMDIHPFPQPSSATVLSLKIESGCRFSPSQKVKDQSSGTKMLGITIVVNFFLPRQPAFGPQERERGKKGVKKHAKSVYQRQFSYWEVTRTHDLTLHPFLLEVEVPFEPQLIGQACQMQLMT